MIVVILLTIVALVCLIWQLRLEYREVYLETIILTTDPGQAVHEHSVLRLAGVSIIRELLVFIGVLSLYLLPLVLISVS